MIDIFYTKLILSFLVGGIWITGTTYVAEKFGSKIGGLITGIPTTIVLTLFFIGWTLSVESAVAATTIVPAIMGLSSLITSFYIVLIKHGLFVAVGIPIAIWFLISFFLVKLNFNSFFLYFLIYVFFLILSFVIGEKISKVKSKGQRKTKLGINKLLFRSVLSGAIVALSVVMTKLGGPLLGGVFATFPAIMISTMVITYLSHGKDFSAAVMKILMISGGINVVVYALSVRLLYPVYGLYVGTIISYLISLISAYFIFHFVRNKMR